MKIFMLLVISIFLKAESINYVNKADYKYKLEENKKNSAVVYEFTPKGNPEMLCVAIKSTIFSANISINCFKKKEK